MSDSSELSELLTDAQRRLLREIVTVAWTMERDYAVRKALEEFAEETGVNTDNAVLYKYARAVWENLDAMTQGDAGTCGTCGASLREV